MRGKSVWKMWKKKHGKDVKKSGGKSLEKNVKKLAWKKPWINDLERWKAWKIFVENVAYVIMKPPGPIIMMGQSETSSNS